MRQFQSPPGATPIHDCSGLKLSWINTQEELNSVEAENILSAQNKYLSRPIQSPLKWFNTDNLIKIHQAMFGDVWEWAGKYRKEVTNIGCHPYMIPMMLAQLCYDVKFWSTDPVDLSFVERSVLIHHRLVSIHPFENGNGRFSRLIADRYLLYWGCQHPIWPVDLQKDGSTRSEYLECLRSADNHDFSPLKKFLECLGVKDPSLKLLKNNPFYKNKLSKAQILALEKAYERLGHS